MKTFRKITAKERKFRVLNNQFDKGLNSFESFLRRESKSPNSGKPSSYKNYLVRFLIHLEEIFDVKVTELESLKTVEHIERLAKLPSFPKFNQDNNRFYSATFASFKRYINSVVNYDIEEQIDQDINNYLQQEFININESKLVKKPTKKKEKQIIKGILTYSRSESEMLKAKLNSNWQCEMSRLHKTFINEKLNKPFVEGHHLIPMFTQDQYENTIDFADNIVTLCPNCHRKIHFGLQEDKYEMIKLLYKKRKELYPNYGIEITLEALLSVYNIKLKTD